MALFGVKAVFFCTTTAAANRLGSAMNDAIPVGATIVKPTRRGTYHDGLPYVVTSIRTPSSTDARAMVDTLEALWVSGNDAGAVRQGSYVKGFEDRSAPDETARPDDVTDQRTKA